MLILIMRKIELNMKKCDDEFESSKSLIRFSVYIKDFVSFVKYMILYLLLKKQTIFLLILGSILKNEDVMFVIGKYVKEDVGEIVLNVSFVRKV